MVVDMSTGFCILVFGKWRSEWARLLRGKPWKKPAVAPLPPTPPRIYKVDPINFRELVQRLTCAPEFMETRSLQSVAPPTIDIRVSSVPNHVHSSPEIGSPFSVMYKDLLDTLELSPMPRHQKVHDSTVDSSETELAVPVFPSLVFLPSAQPRDPVQYHPRIVFLR
ncbi:uncharacterized protein LOC103928862 [Pyrus x bretschneideri]|uniref:uncharacterized protein LOC103928862 n=1 Tax=Pyrus x bretschneideri TaxID=225117 RepID=UPI00202EC091|nr:uncharacterized protein LOC103928862 [Pyrus x bretschneideri]